MATPPFSDLPLYDVAPLRDDVAYVFRGLEMPRDQVAELQETLKENLGINAIMVFLPQEATFDMYPVSDMARMAGINIRAITDAISAYERLKDDDDAYYDLGMSLASILDVE